MNFESVLIDVYGKRKHKVLLRYRVTEAVVLLQICEQVLRKVFLLLYLTKQILVIFFIAEMKKADCLILANNAKVEILHFV